MNSPPHSQQSIRGSLTRHRSYQHLNSPPPPLSTRLHQRTATAYDSYWDRSNQLSSATTAVSAVHQIPKLPTLPHSPLSNSRSYPNLNEAGKPVQLIEENNNISNIVKSEYPSYTTSASSSNPHFSNIGVGYPSSVPTSGDSASSSQPHSLYQRQTSSTSTSSTGISSPLETIPSPPTPFSQGSLPTASTSNNNYDPSTQSTTTSSTTSKTASVKSFSKSNRSKSESIDPSEPDEDAESDRPWDLVPYHVPWGPSYIGYRPGTIPGPEGESCYTTYSGFIILYFYCCSVNPIPSFLLSSFTFNFSCFNNETEWISVSDKIYFILIKFRNPHCSSLSPMIYGLLKGDSLRPSHFNLHFSFIPRISSPIILFLSIQSLPFYISLLSPFDPRFGSTRRLELWCRY
jgi:hypothetical protein